MPYPTRHRSATFSHLHRHASMENLQWSFKSVDFGSCLKTSFGLPVTFRRIDGARRKDSRAHYQGLGTISEYVWRLSLGKQVISRGKWREKKKRTVQPRRVLLECLEPRRLLAAFTVEYRNVNFEIDGTYNGSNMGTYEPLLGTPPSCRDDDELPDEVPYLDTFSGDAEAIGSVQYTSPTEGTGGLTFSAEGSGSDDFWPHYEYRVSVPMTVVDDGARTRLMSPVFRFRTIPNVPTKMPFVAGTSMPRIVVRFRERSRELGHRRCQPSLMPEPDSHLPANKRSSTPAEIRILPSKT